MSRSTRDRIRLWASVISVAVVAGGVSAAVAGGPVSDYVAGVSYSTASSGFSATDSKSVQVDCPAGTNALGGGADIDDDPGEAGNETENVALRTSQPFPNTGGDPDVAGTGWTAIAAETDQVTSGWGLDAWVVCADVNAPGPGGGPVATGSP